MCRGWHWKRRVELAVNLRRSRLTRYDRRINEPCNCKRVPVTWNRMKRKAPPDVATAWRAPVKNSRLWEEIRLALKGREERDERLFSKCKLLGLMTRDVTNASRPTTMTAMTIYRATSTASLIPYLANKFLQPLVMSFHPTFPRWEERHYF